MTIAKLIVKLRQGACLYREWNEVEEDLTALVQVARDKGFEEGETKQAILEVQGRNRFLAEAKCRKCGELLREPPSPADEPMTIATMMDWFNGTGCGELELSQVERKLQALVDAERVRHPGYDRSLTCLHPVCEKRNPCSKPEPEPPPAPEPMTIEKLLQRLQDSGKFIGNWKAVEIDLTALVKAQARRDADLCFATACPHCWKLILIAAGLE